MTMKRKIAAQCCATIVTDLLAITNGLSLGFSTLIIPELYKSNAEIHVSPEELTWISSISHLLTPIGSCISGPLSARVGRRPLIFLAAVLYILSLAMFYWVANDFWTLVLASGMLGVAGGMVSTMTVFYITEIGEPTMRGFFVAKTSGFLSLGMFIHILLGSHMHWRKLALVTISVPAVALLVTFLLPESPIWLASKGRLVELTNSLRWLRGWTSSSDIQTEYDAVLQHLSRTKSESASGPKKTLAKIYLRHGVLAPLRLVIFVFVLDAFNGSSALITYSVLLFQMLHSPLDEYTATIILVALQILATILLMSLVRRVGKRPPTIVSLAVASLSFFGVAVYIPLINERENSFSWIPTVLVFIAMFAMNAGVKNTPFFFAGELFPMEIRNLAISIATALYCVLSGLANKSFLFVIDAFSLSGTFFLLSTINFVGFAVLDHYMPETEGKTFAEIEEFFEKKEKSNLEEAGSSNTEFSYSSKDTVFSF